MFLRKHFLMPTLLFLGLSSLLQAANEEDMGPHDAFPQAYGRLSEKSVYHQNRVRGMKQDLNDYGGRVYDLRRRFDLIFKNKETDQPPPARFEIGEAANWRQQGTQSSVTYQGPATPHRLRQRDPRIITSDPVEVGNPTVTDSTTDTEDEKSPLAFVVEGPDQKPRAQESSVIQRRKFEYYILPRFGMAIPTDSDFNTGLAFAATGGVVRGDWRFGVDFTYSSSDSSFTQSIPGLTTSHVHPGEGENTALALLVGVTRDIPFGAGWTGSVGLGIGGGWGVSDNEVIIAGSTSRSWEDNSGGFAWQLGLGARRPLGEASALFLGYRYLGHPTMSSHNLEAGAELGF